MLLGGGERLTGRHHAELFAFGVNHAHFARANLLVNTYKLLNEQASCYAECGIRLGDAPKHPRATRWSPRVLRAWLIQKLTCEPLYLRVSRQLCNILF